MNHQKIYDTIIEKARLQNRKKLKKYNPEYIYYENHHIIPRCLGGGDEKENKVLLIAREHFICHKLLMCIYSNNRDINYAFIRMAMDKKHNRKISSRDYAYAKQLFIPWNKGKINCYSEDTLQIWSNQRRGQPCKNKNTFCVKGRKFSKLHKDKLSVTKLGEKNPMFGKDTWKTMNKRKIKCEYCGKETTPGNYSRWHGDNCKYNPSNLNIVRHHKKIKCPYCNREIGNNNYKKYHGENCKYRI